MTKPTIKQQIAVLDKMIREAEKAHIKAARVSLKRREKAESQLWKLDKILDRIDDKHDKIKERLRNKRSVLSSKLAR